MNRKILSLPGQKKLIVWLVGLLFLASCARKEVFYFSGPVVRTTATPVLSLPDSITARHLVAQDEPAPASFSASAGEPVPVISSPVNEEALLGKAPGTSLGTPVPVMVPRVQQKQVNRQWVMKAEPEKPKAGMARTGLLLGMGSFVVGIAGLSSLTRDGAILLPLSLLLALGGVVFSRKPLSWNRKHPDNLANAKGAKTGLLFSLFSIGLLVFFGALLLVLL
ncbi:hypothetical protein EFA69_03780 [Rufibacter immobilis]|uniref:Uncharacterized protein n=1 Tax=Rufibacter immobilis TaxID=1348778 RepID=A0A3M9N5I0_9BACT|nr:hypothetical protein [Rufibacter immobilis]RNI32453.1 hypothetical protein EFA69_03780 [Rufibacter immobilis]